MTPYIMLTIAVLLEVCGTLLLPASQGFTKFTPSVTLIAFYIVSFYLLSQVVTTLPVSVVYATWSGLGVFSVAVFGYIFWQQSLHPWAILGMVLIVIGVVLVNVFALTHG